MRKGKGSRRIGLLRSRHRWWWWYDEAQSSSLSQGLTRRDSDPDDVPKSTPSSSASSTRQACYAVLQSWVSTKFMTGCVVLFPVAVTFLVTWWFIQFVDGFFSPIYAQLGMDIFGLGFVTSILFIFFIGIFASSWLGSTVFWIGEWFIKRMPFEKHIYSASKQISAAISPANVGFGRVFALAKPDAGKLINGTSALLIASTTNLLINDGALKLKKLKKVVLKSLQESGITEDKTQLSNLLEHKINSSSKFKVDGEYVCLVATD